MGVGLGVGMGVGLGAGLALGMELGVGPPGVEPAGAVPSVSIWLVGLPLVVPSSSFPPRAKNRMMPVMMAATIMAPTIHHVVELF